MPLINEFFLRNEFFSSKLKCILPLYFLRYSRDFFFPSSPWEIRLLIHRTSVYVDDAFVCTYEQNTKTHDEEEFITAKKKKKKSTVKIL